MAVPIVPVWKDRFVSLIADGFNPFEDYRIKIGGAVIYTGRAYLKNGTDPAALVRVNDICADYLAQHAPQFGGAALDYDYGVIFDVEKWNTVTETWDSADQFKMLADWSYDDAFNPAADPLSLPIDGVAHQGAWLVFTGDDDASSITISWVKADGTTGSDDLDTLIMDGYADVLLDAGGGDWAVYGLDLSLFQRLRTITDGTRTWRVVQPCAARYALHYVNAYGGWDTYIPRGNDKRTDAISRQETGMLSDNSIAYPPEARRNRRTYLEALAVQYELHTALMTDREAALMHHLLNSPHVYLEDTQADALHRVAPVVLTGTATPHLTYDNNGRQLMDYTITAQLAEERLRR